MSELLDLQQEFVGLQAEFQLWVISAGYGLTYGETWRSPEEAAIQAAKGAGVKCSLHTEKLAIDLNAFKDGKELLTATDFRVLGERWKGMHPLARWGGDFTRIDADHFSLTYGGVA